MKNEISDNTVVSVSRLKVHFPIRKGVFGKITGNVKAVDDVSFTIKRGEIFAIVGESGCGKTTTAQAILGLIHQTSGEINLSIGKWKASAAQWEKLSPKERRDLRRHIQVVFQDPYGSLDPRMTVRSIIEEPLVIHGISNGKERIQRIYELLNQVGLSKEYLSRYPHEFSGGQRQRIGIARALATNPELIIADEPVSALDVSIQAQIINLLQDLQVKHNQTQLFISHDLAVVRQMANRLAVMYRGRVCETGSEHHVFTNPLHPYTRLLLDSVPLPGKGRSLRGIASPVADDKDAVQFDNCCLFYPRCNRRKKECLESKPEIEDFEKGHSVACFNPLTGSDSEICNRSSNSLGL
jgi:oligopeptide/dipeptide ABC transporter ATP-binding protein